MLLAADERESFLAALQKGREALPATLGAITVWCARRHGRNADDDDVSVYPNSLNRHLLRTREAKALDGLPYYSLHLARSVMTNFLDTKVSPVASSLMLAHTLQSCSSEARRRTAAPKIVKFIDQRLSDAA